MTQSIKYPFFNVFYERVFFKQKLTPNLVRTKNCVGKNEVSTNVSICKTEQFYCGAGMSIDKHIPPIHTLCPKPFQNPTSQKSILVSIF